VDQAIKEQWVADLTSGEYEQGRGHLCVNGKYCCLGVLCEQAVKAGVVTREVRLNYNGDSVVYYAEESLILPAAVQMWAGVDSENPYVNTCVKSHTLATLNDGEVADSNGPEIPPLPFTEIAQLIDAQL
jgi:hypothetical protein